MIILFGLVIVTSCEGHAMNKTGPLTSCVFSDIEAIVTLNGEPIEGARIVRRWNWQKERSDETTTDVDGRFSFPAVYERHLIRLFPAEFVVSQSLTVHYQAKEFPFWINSKREVELNSELDGQDLLFNCELTNDMEIHRTSILGSLHTLCSWNKPGEN